VQPDKQWHNNMSDADILFPDAVIMVFCKAPVAGQVKTRLMTEISADLAAKIHTELSLKTLDMVFQSRLCRIQLWCSPSPRHVFFSKARQTYSLSLWQQQGQDLGERMNHAFCTTLKTYTRALLIGCDCPTLTKQDLLAALTALNEKADCVLASAEDGGYVLIGLNQPAPELFTNIPWGSNKVLEKTRDKLLLLGLQYLETGQHWDVDTPMDLARYLAGNKP
jgi:rSAM/selenodomain-associated transferase 1